MSLLRRAEPMLLAQGGPGLLPVAIRFRQTPSCMEAGSICRIWIAGVRSATMEYKRAEWRLGPKPGGAIADETAL